MNKKEKLKLKVLLKKIKNGNKEAIEELYRNYNKMTYGIAFSILKNKEDSEDVVQIVFAKLYVLDKEKFPKEKEATWLYSVTKNEALAILKSKHDNISLENIYNLEDNNNEIDKLINRDSYNKIINKLDKKEQEIVSLKVLSKLTFSEIAEMLGESINTIKCRYYKSMYTLKILLSNLSMFIVTATLGILSIKNQNKNANELEDKDKINNDIIWEDLGENDDKENYRDEEKKENVSEEAMKDYHNDIIVEETTNTFENTIVKGESEKNIAQEGIILHNTNYLSIGFFSISAFFLILTITFSIFLAKSQLNVRKKSSK